MKLGTTLVIPAVALLEAAPMAATLLAVWVITRHSRVELTRNKRSLSLRVAPPSDKIPISSCYERLLLTVTFCFPSQLMVSIFCSLFLQFYIMTTNDATTCCFFIWAVSVCIVLHSIHHSRPRA